ncbi:hypothetical protein [Streptococcus thoraltensis]
MLIDIYRSFEDSWDVSEIVDFYDKSILLNTLSKDFFLPEIRIAWGVSNLEVFAVLQDYGDYMMISADIFEDCSITYVLENKKSFSTLIKKR